MKCDFYDKCPISVHQDSVTWRKFYAEKYCNNNCEACERRKLRLVYGMSGVPVQLLPDGSEHSTSVFDKDW